MADITVDVTTDGKRDWIARVLGVELGGVDRGGAPGEGGGKEPPGLRQRLNAIGLRVRELGKAPEAGPLTQRFVGAVQALKDGDWRAAETTLDEIEPLIGEALSSARGEEARRVIGNAKLWRDAVARITDAMAGLKLSVMATLRAEDEHDPEELEEIEQLLDADLAAITDRLSAGLSNQIDAVVNGDAERRKEAIPKIRTRIDEIEASLTGEDVATIEDNGLQAIGIAEPARKALAELRRILDGALN